MIITVNVDRDGELSMSIDTGPGGVEVPPDLPLFELSDEQAATIQGIAERATGRDYTPDSPTLPDDLEDAEDADVIEIERTEPLDVAEAAGGEVPT